MNIRQPLFIIGSPRSGTSLLRLILTCHSEIIVPPECGFMVWLYEKYCTWSSNDSANTNMRAQYIDDLFACKKFDTWMLDREVLDALLAEQQATDYAALSAIIYMAYARKYSRTVKIWGDKNNFHINNLSTLCAIYPDARFLHIVRDGRDVACSYREVMRRGSSSPYSPRLNTEIDAIAAEWSTNVLKVNDYLAKLDASRQMFVRYEDLVQDTKTAISAICRWLDLTFEEKMLSFYEDNRRLQLEPALTLDWKRRTLDPVSADTVGRFRTLLTLDEQRRFSEVASVALGLYRYID